MSIYNAISIRPGYSCLFYKQERYMVREQTNTNSLDNLCCNAHEGVVSVKAAKKIRTAIGWLLEIAKEKAVRPYKQGRVTKFKVNFLTLTLPSKQKHSDTEIKRECLNQFLVEARKKWQVKHYLWRAEPQKNGNIHFHITCDQFIPHTELRDTWNRIVGKLGYISAYQENMKAFHSNGFNFRSDLKKTWSRPAQKKAYLRGFASNWCSPNSTDVHMVKLINNLPAYLAKYCTKNEGGRAIQGKLWGLSWSLSNMKSVTISEDMFQRGFFDKLRHRFEDSVQWGSFFAIIFKPWAEISQQFDSVIHYIFDEYVDFYRNYTA